MTLNCRICNNEIKEPFLSLGNLPLSNSYVNKNSIYKQELYYPLNVYICLKCGLMQINESENIENIFSSLYTYYSSYSSTWVNHARNYVDMIIERFNYNKKSLVVEIASNDGYLLQFFRDKKIPYLGIEPSELIAKKAIADGINTDISFFNKDYALKNFKDEQSRADLIIGNNVFAHNPNLHDFVEGLKIMLKMNGVITLEFPHLLELIKHTQFDTIYHEHFSYFSLKSLICLFDMHNLTIFDVDKLDTHGGSIRVYIKHKDNVNIGDQKTFGNVRYLLKEEENFNLYDLKTYNDFKNRVYKIKRDFIRILCAIKDRDINTSIICYGAAAKGNTLLNFCNIGLDFIDYIVDVNENKQGLYLPGSHIPIVHPDMIKNTKPDYVIIIPWNIESEIKKYLLTFKCMVGKIYIILDNGVCTGYLYDGF